MTRRIHLRSWQRVHQWTSLICTGFLLILCVTGLPLIFAQEIDNWLDPDPPYAVLPANTPMANLDGVVQVSRQRYPGQVVTSVFVDDDEPQIIVSLAPSWATAPTQEHWIKFDARTAQVLDQSKPPSQQHMTFIDLMLRLHIDLFADLPGQLFLAVIGMLLVTALISGVVLYGPFMRHQDFGAVRTGRSRWLTWLDLHNVLGVVTLSWGLVVGVTGTMNELSTPLFALWQRTDVQAVLRPYQGRRPLRATDFSSVQTAYHTAECAVPGMVVTSIVFPGDPDASLYHYLFWAHGKTPLTSRLFSPILVDARAGTLTAVVRMPWYLRVLEVCRPLHFGDYGGLPLKIIWSVLDLVTITVLVSGLYLWFVRRKSRITTRLARIRRAGPEPVLGDVLGDVSGTAA